MDAVVLLPTIDEAAIKSFGQTLSSRFTAYKSDRKPAEEKWMQHLRMYRGIYDPEILQNIASDMSKAYPKVFRWKLIGLVARLMQMLFPQTEKNYAVNASPLPDLSVAQLQEVLDTLVNLTAQRDQIDPAKVELKDEDIEKAVYEYASHKAARMELKVDDDLKEMEYVTLARRVVFSAGLYNIGVVEGPLHKKVKARVWVKDPYTGKYTAKEVDKLKPLYEFVRCWDWYPDMSANTLEHLDGSFRRHIMTREQVLELADRDDFLADRIRTWLKQNEGGNYKAEWWEATMKGEPKGDQYTVANKEGRKYEAASWWGAVRGHELRACGVEVADAQLSQSFQANVWLLGNEVIKCKLAPLEDTKHFHAFVFEEDDLSLLGNGLGDTLRDSQISICETARAALDNMSVIGPSVEVNDDLLTPGQDTSIRKHKTWHREGDGAAANYPAVRDLKFESHLPELGNLLQMWMDFADKESGLPPASVGDVSGGGSEALRTTKNASMFLGAAALPVRDTVRNFDTFTISIITALVKWNTKFDPNASRDGDSVTIARGSTSLIAKEVLAGNLAEFRAGITEEEKPYLDTRKMLMVRARANDIPTDEVMLDEAVAQANIDAQQQSAQKQQDLQEGLVRAQVEEMFANAIAHIAQAKKADASAEDDAKHTVLDYMTVMLDAVKSGHENAIKEKIANKPAPKAKA